MRAKERLLQALRVREAEAEKKGRFEAYCFGFTTREHHTDAQAVAHFRGGEMELLTYFQRQRIACREVIANCKECFITLSRTGHAPPRQLTDVEAEYLARWVNEGGLKLSS